MCEWSRTTGAWARLPDDGSVEDPCFVAALPVDALVKAARADDAVARALLAKGSPVLVEAVATSRTEGFEAGRAEGVEAGRAEGEVEAMRRVLLRVLDERGWSLDDARREQVVTCADAGRLEAWVARALTAAHLDEVFA